jgi:hypothetical protein
MGSRPRSTRTLEILTTRYDSCLASMAHSPLILSTRAQALSSSTDRPRSLMGCMLCSSFSASVTSLTSKSLEFHNTSVATCKPVLAASSRASWGSCQHYFHRAGTCEHLSTKDESLMSLLLLLTPSPVQ